MKICVAGLGLIGGSIALALKRAGYEVYGMNRSPEAVDYAVENDIIDYGVPDFNIYGATAAFDVVFVAMPPAAAIDFMQNRRFKRGAIVADVCGIKREIEKAVYSAPRDFLYVGAHPMAGKEVSTIKNACADLFDNASMVLTVSHKTSRLALNLMEHLTEEMGFKYIVECSAEVHDKKIAYTSQLAHIVSNCYVKDGAINNCLAFTGGSFQDMTRIAGVDESVWSQLYLGNADNLSASINELISNLTAVDGLIKSGDKAKLEKFLKDGAKRCSLSNIREEDGIRTIYLK
ncbi:MAG: prephenate dehydrogenase/arogenate dehydrogenase family protein [Clostridia bacterium]|nr:prephenate dehydrogenase/arogenate dehydrogenase family protein [Clostridia bacterium]